MCAYVYVNNMCVWKMKRLTKGRCSDPCEVMFWYVLLCFSQNDNKLKELTIARFTEDLESTQGRLAEFNALQKSEFQLRMELDAMKNKEVNNKIDLQLYSFVSTGLHFFPIVAKKLQLYNCSANTR